MICRTETIGSKKRIREVSNIKTKKRIRVEEEDLFRIAYSYDHVDGENNEHDHMIRFFVRGADCASSCEDLVPINQLRKEEFWYKNYCTTMYITKDNSKVALSMEGKGDRRLEFQASVPSDNDMKRLFESLKRVLDHLALPGSMTITSHQCCSITCFQDNWKTLIPFLSQSKRKNPLKCLLFTRINANTEIRRMITSNYDPSFSSIAKSIPDENETMLIGNSLPKITALPQLDAQQVNSLQAPVSEGSAEQDCDSILEWVLSGGFSSLESNDETECDVDLNATKYDEIHNRANELIQKIKSCERKTPVQVQNLYEEIVTFIKDDGEKHIFHIPVEILTLLEWMSIILNFRNTCLIAIQYLKEKLENLQMMKSRLLNESPHSIVTVYSRFGDLLLEADKFKDSFSWLQIALEVAKKKNEVLEIPVLLSLAIYYLRIGDRNLATSSVSKALIIVTEIELKDKAERDIKKSQKAACTGIQGRIAFQECKYEKAKILFKEELSAYDDRDVDIGIQSKRANCYLRLCDAMLNLSDFQNALDHCNRSLDIWNTLLSSFTEEGKSVDHSRIAECLQYLGDHALMTGNLVQAFEHHRAARDMRRRVLIEPNSNSDGYHSIVSVSDRRIGHTHLALGNNELAEAHFGEKKNVDNLALIKLKPPKRLCKLLISHPIKRSIHSDPEKLRYLLDQYDAVMANENAQDYEQYAYHMGAASTFQRVGDVALLLATTDPRSEEERLHLLSKAEDRYRLCLRIREGKDGCSPSIPAIAATQDCLGKLYYHKGVISQARIHFESAHQMRVGKKGVYCDYVAHHPDVAASYVYLGAIDLIERRIAGLDNLKEAMKIYRETFRGWRNVLRADTFSNDVNIAVSNLAETDHPLVADLERLIVKCESLNLLDTELVRDEVEMLLKIPNPAVLLI